MESNFELRRKKPKSPTETTLDDLELSIRTYQFLEKLGLKTLQDILEVDELKLSQEKTFEKRYLREIQDIKNEYEK